jgi:hypothetical protein
LDGERVQLLLLLPLHAAEAPWGPPRAVAHLRRGGATSSIDRDGNHCGGDGGDEVQGLREDELDAKAAEELVVPKLVADGEAGDLLRWPSLSLSFSGVPMDGAQSLKGPWQWGAWWARLLLEEVLHHGRSEGCGWATGK